MTAGTHTPRNRREAEALARLVQLLADGVAFTEAVWTASARGMDLDTARLVDLHDTHTRTAAPVATATDGTSHTPNPWHYDAEQGAILTSDSRPIAFVTWHAADSLAQENANGRLIAAAPELLRCAVMALEELQEAARVNPLARVAIRALEAVIAAAGEHPTHPRG